MNAVHSPIETMQDPNPLSRLLSRWQASLSKRIFWRQHLREAIDSIETAKREMPTVETMTAIPMLFRGKGYYRTLELKQNMTELLGLVRHLADQPLRRVCEIGTFKGGTLFIWCQLADPEARIVSIDLPGGAFGGGYSARSIPFFQSFCRERQQLDCLRQSSHDAATLGRLETLLQGKPLDFLFIDGDHTYEGVKKDFEMYSPLVRPGGWIGFHDIVARPQQPSIQVHRLWNELNQEHTHHEFIESSTQRRRIGIGLIEMK